MTPSSVFDCLWTARLLLQTVLLAWMLAQGSYREFPMFVLYTVDAVVQTVVLQAMIHSPSITGPQYFVAYSVGGALAAVLSFFVIHEVFRHALRDYPAVRQLGTTLFRVSTVILLLTGVLIAWLRPPAELWMLMSKVDQVNLTVSIMQCGLVIVLLFLSRKIGLSLRARTFGIAFGFGIMGSVDLPTFAIRSRFESVHASPVTTLLNAIGIIAALCTVAVWTVYFVRPDTVTELPSRPLPGHDLESWNQELRRLLR